MLLELCLALLQVQGLEAGERFTVLPPQAVTLPEGTFVHGRVVDAFTGAPVQGAAIECWTEEITARSGGLRRVGEARSDERGQFRLRWRHGGLVAQKVRVRADGYLSFSGAPGDEDLVELYPSPSSSGSTASGGTARNRLPNFGCARRRLARRAQGVVCACACAGCVAAVRA